MRATLRDPALMKHAGQFVWLALNYDEPRNKQFFSHHDDTGALPAFFVINPGTEVVERAWYGGASATDFEGFLKQQSNANSDSDIRRGDGLIGAGDSKGAVAAYRAALRRSDTTTAEHERALEHLMIALQESGDGDTCVAIALQEAPTMSRTHAFVNVVSVGLNCEVNKNDPHSEKLEALAREALSLPIALEDDHFEIYNALIAAHRIRGDISGSARIAEEYLAFVERSPPATSNDQRSARDAARLRAGLALKAPERIIPALEASDNVLRDSNSAARLAKAYSAANRYQDVISSVARGLSLHPGPLLRGRLLLTRADALSRHGDTNAARQDLTSALEAAEHVAVKPDRARLVQQIQLQLSTLK